MLSDQPPENTRDEDEDDSLPASNRPTIDARGSQGFVHQPQGLNFHNYYVDQTTESWFIKLLSLWWLLLPHSFPSVIN